MNKALFALGAIALFAATSMMMMNHQEERVNVNEEVLALWKNFKLTHNKKYATAQEEMYRLQVFLDNLNYINENQGDTYTLGINVLADITPEEFRATYLGYIGPKDAPTVVEEVELNAPASVNWVQAGVVPPILNQANCGSCWAFSAAGSISIAYNINNKNNALQLSPEQLVQCSSAYGNQGCNGGLMDSAFRYAQKYPLATLAQYPYTSGTGTTGSCNTSLQSQGKYGVTGYTDVTPAGSTAALQNAIAIKAVSIAVDANNWQYYTSGIFSKCGTSLDHGVIAVGYTSTYWYVRNSWGTGWGSNGYIQLAPGNTCGLANQASYPSV
jgi:C1A family cysteine protease